jgi:hypothetical protein
LGVGFFTNASPDKYWRGASVILDRWVIGDSPDYGSCPHYVLGIMTQEEKAAVGDTGREMREWKTVRGDDVGA